LDEESILERKQIHEKRNNKDTRLPELDPEGKEKRVTLFILK